MGYVWVCLKGPIEGRRERKSERERESVYVYVYVCVSKCLGGCGG